MVFKLVWAKVNVVVPKAAVVGVVSVSKGVLVVADDTTALRKRPLGVVSVKLKTSLLTDAGIITTNVVGLA